MSPELRDALHRAASYFVKDAENEVCLDLRLTGYSIRPYNPSNVDDVAWGKPTDWALSVFYSPSAGEEPEDYRQAVFYLDFSEAVRWGGMEEALISGLEQTLAALDNEDSAG